MPPNNRRISAGKLLQRSLCCIVRATLHPPPRIRARPARFRRLAEGPPSNGGEEVEDGEEGEDQAWEEDVAAEIRQTCKFDHQLTSFDQQRVRTMLVTSSEWSASLRRKRRRFRRSAAASAGMMAVSDRVWQSGGGSHAFGPSGLRARPRSELS